jgi:membrane protein required for colicin V production
MNILDWCVLAFLAGSVLLGVLRGGAKEVLGLGGWIGGLVFAFLGAPLIAPLLQDIIAAANPRWIAAFILIFITVRLLAWGLGKLLAEIIAAAKLGALDKLIGAVFGVFRAAVITLFVAFLCMLTRMPHTPLWQSSTSAPIIQNLVIALTPFLPADAQRWIKP